MLYIWYWATVLARLPQHHKLVQFTYAGWSTMMVYGALLLFAKEATPEAVRNSVASTAFAAGFAPVLLLGLVLMHLRRWPLHALEARVRQVTQLDGKRTDDQLMDLIMLKSPAEAEMLAR